MIYVYNTVREGCDDTSSDVVDTSRVQDPAIRQFLETAQPDEPLFANRSINCDDLENALEEGSVKPPCNIDFICTIYYP